MATDADESVSPRRNILMSLESELFRGDPQLEAAAVSDPAHIIPGAAGEHIARIQRALITLDGAMIDELELTETRYGTSTSNAVLAYKTKRGIINRAYQIKPDNIVGKMTMARLDSEMLAAEMSAASSTTHDEGVRQADWRWCNKCQGLTYSLGQPSVCPAGGSHDHRGSGNYALAVDDPSAQGQSDWRWCRKCQGLAFSLNQPSVCPAGGSHDHSGSGNYALAVDDPSAQGQSDWRWCRKCQGLAFSLNQPSVCPAGGSHDHSQSGNYTLGSVLDVPKVETVRCYPPEGETQGSFPVISSQPFGLATAVVAPTPADLVAEAQIHMPLAISWVTTAQARLSAVRTSIARFKVYSPAELSLALPFKTHFKIDIASQTDVVAGGRLDRVASTFVRIQQALGALATRIKGDPNEPAKAVAPLGGFDIPGEMVTIGADFLGQGSTANLKAAVLIHECAHFVDAGCGHVASERPAPNGSAITDANGKRTNPAGKNYAQMDFELAICNAYSFAQCAAHCGLGNDQRPL
jgi:hypothetical protein